MNELPTSAYGVLKQFSVSKEGVQRFSIQVINAVKNGEVNALELKAYLKAMEQIIEIVDKATRHEQLTEAEKYGEKSFEVFGCKIEKAEVGTKYDYSGSGDPIYNHRLQIFEEAKKQLDDRAAFLKALKEPLVIVDDESGEVATLRPPLKKSTDGLKFSIK
jgi:hypothetical protein